MPLDFDQKPEAAPAKTIKKNDFDESWAKTTRLARMAMLSKPNPRYLVPYPNPLLVNKDPTKVRQAALVYRPSKRILMLSKYQNKFYTPKYVKPPRPEHFVNPEALEVVPTPRIIELAERPEPVKKKISKKAMQKRLKKIRKFIEKRPEWLAMRAAPKKPPPEIKPSKHKRQYPPMSNEEKEDWLKGLAQPKPAPPPTTKDDIFKISPAALKYEPTRRIVHLANHKDLPEEAYLDMLYDPYLIPKKALEYKASNRIKEMAVPIVRKAAEDTDIKDNPFKVLERALTAICTKRTAELAKPVVRE